MGIISAENSDRLYWLGRYTERVYTTIRIFSTHFDSMLDLDEMEYQEYCRKQEIPNIYSSARDFATRYCFDEKDENSICANLMRAYDNAIVLREEIGSGTLSYIQLAVYAMNKAKESYAPLIQLQKVVDNIVAFWGMADDSITDDMVIRLIKIGKRVERIDLYARMQAAPALLRREMKRLNTRLEEGGIRCNVVGLKHLGYLVEMDQINYDEVVREVEQLVQV